MTSVLSAGGRRLGCYSQRERSHLDRRFDSLPLESPGEVRSGDRYSRRGGAECPSRTDAGGRAQTIALHCARVPHAVLRRLERRNCGRARCASGCAFRSTGRPRRGANVLLPGARERRRDGWRGELEGAQDKQESAKGGGHGLSLLYGSSNASRPINLIRVRETPTRPTIRTSA